MIQSPNQPLRWEIESFGGEGSMQQVCGDIVSEGGEGEEGTNTGFVVEDFQANNAGIEYAVAGLRLKEAYRNTTVISQSLSLLTENNDDCIWRVTINPTVSGTVTWVPEPGSSIEIFKGTTSNVVTPGTGKTIAIGVMPGNSQVDKTLRNALGLGSYLDGTTDRIFVTIEPISAGLDVFAGVTVQEYI